MTKAFPLTSENRAKEEQISSQELDHHRVPCCCPPRRTTEVVRDRQTPGQTVPDLLPGNENRDEVGDWFLKSQQPCPSGSGKTPMSWLTSHGRIPAPLPEIFELSLSSRNSGEFMSHQGLNLVTLSPKVLNHTTWRWICDGSVPVSRIPLDTVWGKRKEQLCNPAHVNPCHFSHVWPCTNSFLSVSFGGFVTKREIKITISARGWLGASVSLLWVRMGPWPSNISN